MANKCAVVSPLNCSRASAAGIIAATPKRRSRARAALAQNRFYTLTSDFCLLAFSFFPLSAMRAQNARPALWHVDVQAAAALTSDLFLPEREGGVAC